MHDYKQASEKLGNRQSRKLDHHTYLQRRDDHTIAVLYHATDVVTFRDNGDVTLNSGGWRTLTTKERIGNYSPFYVSQERGIWYATIAGNTVPFADGLTLHADGSITGAGDDPKAELKLRRKVNEYSRAFVAQLRAGKIGEPGAGDCFFCLMREVATHKPLGECTRDGDHILSHLKECYYVPSLLFRALELRGSVAMRDTVARNVRGEHSPFESDWLYKDIARTLARYIYGQLGMASGIRAA